MSLSKQNRTDFEILVIDNAAVGETEALVKTFADDSPVPVRYVAHPTGGLAGARNRGIADSASELLLFTDDDVTFSSDWVDAYITAFDAHPDMVAAGGPIRPHWLQPPPSWLIEYIERQPTFSVLALMDLPGGFTLRKDGFFYAANMAVRREVFTWTSWPPDLFVRRLLGNGERGVNVEIWKRGGLVGYVPAAMVNHCIPPERMDLAYWKRWARNSGASTMYERWWNKPRTLAAAGYDLLLICREHWRAWLLELRLAGRKDPRALDVQLHASHGRGELMYLWWLLVDPAVQRLLDAPMTGILAPRTKAFTDAASRSGVRGVSSGQMRYQE